MFGPHLTLDLYGCNPAKLSDPKFIYKLLDEFPEVIGMHKISKPSVTDFPGNPNSFDKGGVSAFVLITESHISIHTFTADKFASVDIFSCNPFNIDKATKCLMEMLGAKKAERNFIERGKGFVKHYPKDVKKSKDIVVRERELVV
ncbi:adenosylmethionine decarboxylase [archaeon]|nr:MAG: adenosylmethionine decarboxylase [archaeon]